MWWRNDADGKHVGPGGCDGVGDVEGAADECAVNVAEAAAIEPDLGTMVDAVELEPEAAVAGGVKRGR
jgi:hypothetical protein